VCFGFLKGVFRGGDAQGNMPSPRMDITLAELLSSDYVTTTVQNTNSMEPLIDIGHTVFLSNQPKHLNDLKTGDVIVWRQGSREIIHSITNIGTDAKGWFCQTQGLNVKSKDPEIIRKEDVVWAALGVLWTKGDIGWAVADGD